MLRIDFISDINCPWCALGLANLEQALNNIGDDLQIDLHFQPFELNPTLPVEGVKLVDYLFNKYSMSADQINASYDTFRERGAEVGFYFGKREFIWNTFNAHRLLYWTDKEGPTDSQRQLKLALMQAYQGEGKNPNDIDVLLTIVEQIGLDVNRAREVLTSETFTQEVRELEQQWQSAGINAVPSIVINQRQLIQGAQPIDVLENALRQLANT